MLKTIAVTVLSASFVFLIGCEQGETTVSNSRPSALDESDSLNRPSTFVGNWYWTTHNGQKMVLHNDGRVTRIEGLNDHRHKKGSWHLRDDGVLEVTSTIEFRVDDDAESLERYGGISLMDIETIPTDHDFAWFKSEDDGARAEIENPYRGSR